jgi:phage terminase large subunit GpA-like protein
MTVVSSAWKAGIKPDPYLDFVEWANTHFRLTKESSVEPGKYRSSRTPWVEEILRELSPQSPTQEVVVIKPTQAGYTTLANIMLCSVAHLYPGPCMLVQPTDDMVKKHSKKKLAPTVRAIPALKGIIKPVKSRDAGNTLLLKEFPGGSWTLTGSNSPVSARSDSIRYLILDDYDGFIQDAGGEGAPGNLFKKRTDAFGSKKKIYINSTPTTKGVSNIEGEWEESSQGHFCVPCPHCQEYQFLVFGGKDAEHGIKFTRDDDGQITDVWYVCEHCQSRIEEWQKTDMLIHGKYVHEYPDRKKRGFKTNSLYSPLGWVSWAQVVDEFLKAAKQMKQGDPRGMKVWTNTRMADVWEEAGDRPEWVKIKSRAESYQPLQIPTKEILLMSAGTDVQHNRLATSIYGWGKGEECWLIYHIEIAGDPMHADVWQQHDQLIGGTFRRADGVEMHILSCGVDAGDGNTTQAVRNYCRTRAPKVFALKGASTPGRPVLGLPTKQDLTWKGEKIEGGIELWPIGTDTAKSTLYARFNVTDPGPGRIHTYIGLDDEFYEQITAEKLVTRWVKGYPVKEWHNVRGNKRNEALDTWVYAYAAAIRAGLPYIDLQSQKQATKQPKQAKRPQRNNKTKRERW